MIRCPFAVRQIDRRPAVHRGAVEVKVVGEGLGPALHLGLEDDAAAVRRDREFAVVAERPRGRVAVDPGHQIGRADKAGVADIRLIYDSGPRYTLGKVSFAGDTPFDEELLQRMVPFKSGAPYDSELIAELNQNLQASGFFEGVRVDAAPAASALFANISIYAGKSARTASFMLAARVRIAW